MDIASENSVNPVHSHLPELRIVLVETSHPGNIGASARAMKTMGLTDLHLVSPANFPSAEATARAAGADDILERAGIHENLAEALSGCDIVYGTTARSRRIDWPTVAPRPAAADMIARAVPTALVFGRERSGLTNAELDLCQHAICIDTNPDYSSLNLAQAVQICAYELRLAASALAEPTSEQRPRHYAGDEIVGAPALELLRGHCLAVMERVEYHDPARPKLLDRRLRRFFNRSELRHSEVQIVRGVLSAIEARLDRLERDTG